MEENLFPIMDGPDIPLEVIIEHEIQALKNHGQTLKRLAERGGLTSLEAIAVMEGRSYRWVINTLRDNRAKGVGDEIVFVHGVYVATKVVWLEDDPPASVNISVVKIAEE